MSSLLELVSADSEGAVPDDFGVAGVGVAGVGVAGVGVAGVGVAGVRVCGVGIAVVGSASLCGAFVLAWGGASKIGFCANETDLAFLAGPPASSASLPPVAGAAKARGGLFTTGKVLHAAGISFFCSTIASHGAACFWPGGAAGIASWQLLACSGLAASCFNLGGGAGTSQPADTVFKEACAGTAAVTGPTLGTAGAGGMPPRFNKYSLALCKAICVAVAAAF